MLGDYATCQDTHYISITKTYWVLLFREVIIVYYENLMKHINTVFGQNAEFFNVKAYGTYSKHSIIKS
jgi:hypothetical protein